MLQCAHIHINTQTAFRWTCVQYVPLHLLSRLVVLNGLLVRHLSPKRPIGITAPHLSGKCVAQGSFSDWGGGQLLNLCVELACTWIASVMPCSHDTPSSSCSGDHTTVPSRSRNIDSQVKHQATAPFKNTERFLSGTRAIKCWQNKALNCALAKNKGQNFALWSTMLVSIIPVSANMYVHYSKVPQCTHLASGNVSIMRV